MKVLKQLFISLILLTPMAHAEQIVFSEVMYHPPAGGHEFIEVQNLTATPFDIAQWELTEGASFTFPDFASGPALDSFLKAFERIILCDTDPAAFRAAYSVPNSIRVFGPWSGSLSNGGERVTLADKMAPFAAAFDTKTGILGHWHLMAPATASFLPMTVSLSTTTEFGLLPPQLPGSRPP